MRGELTTVRKVVHPRPRRGESRRLTPVANAYFHFVVVWPRGVLSDADLLRAAQQSESFGFWDDPEEDIYSPEDGQPV